MHGEPLSLERYYFNKVFVEAARSLPSEKVTPTVDLSVSLTRNQATPNRFRLQLQADLGSSSSVANAAYRGTVTVTGWFVVDPNYVTDQAGKETLVKLGGAPMLYSAVREMIASITSRGRWRPTVILPITNFDFLLSGKPEIGSTTEDEIAEISGGGAP